MTFMQGYNIVLSSVFFLMAVVMIVIIMKRVRNKNFEPNFMIATALGGWIIAAIGWELLVCNSFLWACVVRDLFSREWFPVTLWLILPGIARAIAIISVIVIAAHFVWKFW